MNSLQLLRMQEELNSCRERLDAAGVSAYVDKLRGDYKTIISEFGKLVRRDSVIRAEFEIPDSEVRAFVLSIAEPFKRMVKLGRQFTDEPLESSGMMSSTAAHSLVLKELRELHPSKFGDNPVRAEALRIVRDADGLLGDSIAVPEAVGFFSHAQARADLNNAFDKALAAADSFEKHNTNWWKVAKGAIKVAGGLIAKAGGALACATGAGCVVGGAAVVTGTVNIIDGVEQITEGLEEK